MLNPVADGVWVRQSAWVWSNAIVVRGERGLVLVDPGIDGSELDQLAADRAVRCRRLRLTGRGRGNRRPASHKRMYRYRHPNLAERRAWPPLAAD